MFTSVNCLDNLKETRYKLKLVNPNFENKVDTD
jgi:hypothetical protein